MSRRRRSVRLGAVVVAGAALTSVVRLGPLPAEVAAAPRSVAVVDRFGNALDGSSARIGVGRASASRKAVSLPLARSARTLALATVAAEDERFSSHLGVDPIAVGRAFAADVRAASFVQGGSTLTQQLVKIRRAAANGASGRGGFEKVREALYALRLEHRMSKEEILSAYLAEAPYGGAVVGAEAASQIYFGRSSSQLTWGQAAYLAALPQRPTRFDPRRNPKAAITRQRWILGRLRNSGVINVAEEQAARRETITIASKASTAIAPHFLRAVRDGSLCKALGPVGCHSASSTPAPGVASALTTTLDGDLQRDVAGIAAHQRELLKKYGAANVAVVVLDNATGAIRAYEGSGGWENALNTGIGGMIDGARQPRQTGSIIKAFVYALAFDEGARPADLVDDAPYSAAGADNEFRPQNYDHRYRGELTLREALAQSVNVAAVRTLAAHGPSDLVDLLNRAGITIPQSTYGLSLALGAAEVDLMHLTAAYATFARGGRSLQPVAFEPALPQRGKRVVSPEAAYLVTDVLADNDARTPAFGAQSALRFDFPVSAKTGTSSDFHDNWVIGSSARVTVGVWVGNFDRTPLKNASGVTGAGPVFRSVMLAAQERLAKDGPVRSLLGTAPAGIERAQVCRRSNCQVMVSDWITTGAVPRNQPVAAAKPDASASSDASVPAAPTARTSRLSVLSPSSRGAYVIDAARSFAQALPLQAAGGKPPYSFTVNGVRTSESWWSLKPGSHVACAIDATGTSACRRFVVRSGA